MKDRGDDEAFDGQLRERFLELRASAGPCPDGQRLVRFVYRELSADDAKRVSDHLAGCGLCDAAVLRLQRANRVGLWRPWPGYALAGCLGIALAVLLWHSPRTESPVESHSPAFESIQVLSLDATRTAQTAQTRGPLPPLVGLAFFLPIESGMRYTASLRDRSGSTILSQPDIQSYDRKGNFLLILPRSAVRPGTYQLRVEDSTGTRYHFDFTL